MLINIRNYDSAHAVGLEIIRQLPEEAMSTCIAHAYIDPDDASKIRIITRPHMQWHLDNDRVNCKVCGNFFSRFAGGLRTHQVQEHKMNNNAVRDVMFVNSWQVIVYADPLLRSSPTLSSTISLSVDTTAEADTLCNGGSPFSINCVEENVESPNKSVKDLWLEYAKSSNMHVIKSFRQRQLASSLQLQSQEERDKDRRRDKDRGRERDT